ncbi:MAG: S41 family peptidase [FCB group bacterium]|jgi:carboxyl-terminal processing protease|nr:S41 family peptidase [FCB group bacterium]
MRNTKSQFFGLLLFLVASGVMLTNGFTTRIFAQNKELDVFQSVDPIANVLDEILDNYVDDPQVDHVVEGALTGMMNALDDHCSYIPADVYKHLREDTQGEFEGIGISIRLDADKLIEVVHAVPNSPAAEAGLLPGDRVIKIDGVSTRAIGLDEARDRIRGPIGTSITLTVFRRADSADSEAETLEIPVKRGKIPLESVLESRLLDGGIAYIRVQDFKDNTAADLTREIKKLNEGGAMKGLVLDLRWNPGGLLTASKDVAELFLPNNTLVTYTKGRDTGGNNITEDLKLYTEREAILPQNLPVVVLVNEWSASAAEIVTGCLQYWSRALIVGEKTYGKGSVQTIIPLQRPAGAALRLTTALYYTPAEVTINKRGIIPDVSVPMDEKQQRGLFRQMVASYKDDFAKVNSQNHGSVTGDAASPDTVEDTQLQRAVEIIKEEPLFEKLIQKYHKDPKETQVAAIGGEADQAPEAKEAAAIKQ